MKERGIDKNTQFIGTDEARELSIFQSHEDYATSFYFFFTRIKLKSLGRFFSGEYNVA